MKRSPTLAVSQELFIVLGVDAKLDPCVEVLHTIRGGADGFRAGRLGTQVTFNAKSAGKTAKNAQVLGGKNQADIGGKIDKYPRWLNFLEIGNWTRL